MKNGWKYASGQTDGHSHCNISLPYQGRVKIIKSAYLFIQHVSELAVLFVQHPRVRYAACNALGQMATDFGPTFQKKFHQKVVNVTCCFYALKFFGCAFLED